MEDIPNLSLFALGPSGPRAIPVAGGSDELPPVRDMQMLGGLWTPGVVADTDDSSEPDGSDDGSSSDEIDDEEASDGGNTEEMGNWEK